MNVEGVAFHATALQQVANDLQKSINQVREPTVGSESVWTKWVMGYVSSTLILRALATEQMLKVLSYMRTGNYRTDGKGHDLLVLFDELDKPTRQLIDDLAKTHGIRPLEQIPREAPRRFREFSIYPDGGQSRTQADLQDLDKALPILTAVFGRCPYLC